MGLALTALVVLVCLAVVPGAAQPFTAPKLVLGTAGPAVILLWALATGRLRWRVPAGLALALGGFAVAMGLAAARFGAEAFPQFAFLLSGPLLVVLILSLDDAEASLPARGLVWAAVIVAAVAILQRVGLDPWRLAGWAPAADYASSRMRAYATLGNPNFVASVLALALPWTLVVASGVTVRISVALVLLAGILATGSRTGLIAAGVGLAGLVWLRPAWRDRRRRLGAALAAVAVAVAFGVAVAVSERAVGDSIVGRLVPVRVAWPHALERPILGLGLGAVARQYGAWQAAFFADPSHASLAHFAGTFDHLHHEPLEWLVETGVVGMAAWIAVVVLALRAGVGSTSRSPSGAPAPPIRTAARAALAAVAVLCLADFPLHRPADYLAAWLALAIAARPTAAAARSPSS